VRSAESLVDALQCIGGAQCFPLRPGELQEGEQFIASFFERGADGLAPQPPLAQEAGARLFDCFASFGI
jgi:hypothetical protein